MRSMELLHTNLRLVGLLGVRSLRLLNSQYLAWGLKTGQLALGTTYLSHGTEKARPLLVSLIFYII